VTLSLFSMADPLMLFMIPRKTITPPVVGERAVRLIPRIPYIPSISQSTDSCLLLI